MEWGILLIIGFVVAIIWYTGNEIGLWDFIKRYIK